MHYLRAMPRPSRRLRLLTACLGVLCLICGVAGGLWELGVRPPCLRDAAFDPFEDAPGMAPRGSKPWLAGLRPGTAGVPTQAAAQVEHPGLAEDQDAKPLAGVTVRFWKPGDETPVLTVTSDDRGRFALPADRTATYRMEASKAGYHSDGEAWAHPNENPVVRL